MPHEISFIIKYQIQKLNHQKSLEYQNHLCIACCIVYYHIKIIQAHHSQNQRQEPVADGIEDARDFLNDFCAHVVNSIEEVAEYFSEDYDMDTYTKEDILDMDEVYDIGDGRYLIVE